MRETILKKNYKKAFKTVVILAVVLALVSAVALPVSLSRQLGDLAALRQAGPEQAAQLEGARDGHMDREELWKQAITPLSAVNYAVIGALGVLWLALAAYYWLLVVAWLYKSALGEGMNRSLWPIAGLFFNLAAVFAFLIVRDNPRRARTAGA